MFANTMDSESVSSPYENLADKARIAISRAKFATKGAMSASRGRGWVQGDKNQLSTPGKPLHIDDIDFINRINIINSVKTDNLEQKVEEFVKLCDNSDFQDSLDKLYEHARIDKEFATKLIMLVCASQSHTGEKKLMRHVLRKAQIKYEGRIEVREKNLVQFSNDIYIVSELLSYFLMKESLNESIGKILSKALVDYMEMLLETATVGDIKMFTDQMIIHGECIYLNWGEQVDTMMVTVRQTIVERDLDSILQQMLLYTIDLVNHQFRPLPKKLQEYYEHRLGKSFMQLRNKCYAV